MSTKRQSLTIDTKLKILQAVDENNKKATGTKKKLGDIADEFGIKQCTLSAIVKGRETIESRAFSGCFSSSTKKFRHADKFSEIDEALLIWFKGCRGTNTAVSDELLKSKAQSFISALEKDAPMSDSCVSMSWIQRWKHRHNIVSVAMCGESGDVSVEDTQHWTATTLPNLLQRFSPADVFNGDETGLFWKLTPQRTLAFVGEKCHGGKHSKERITVFVAASMTGEKLPLMIIGKSERPRAFRNKHVPLEYTNNSKAWMTSSIFEDHMRKIDRRMTAANRKIVMVVDNCPAHPKLDSLRAVTLVFLPPNTTSKTQPMDCGVIWSLKSHYRKHLMTELIISHDSKLPFQPDLLMALHWLQKAWACISSETIVNCFHSAGFRAPSASPFASITSIHTASDDGFGNIFERIRQEFSLPNEVSAEMFNAIDGDIISTEIPSDSDIINSLMPSSSGTVVSADHSDDDSPADVETPAPSLAEALQMLHKVHLCLLKNSSSTDDFHNLECLQLSLSNMALAKKTQRTLDDFFVRE